MNCRYCGSEIFEQDRFCGKCGRPIDSTDSTNAIGDILEAETNERLLLRKFVGDKKSSYYLAKWNQNKHYTWNWSAAIFSIPWLGYRKMYKMIVGILLTFLVLDIVIALGGFDEAVSDRAIGIGISIFIGMIGNSSYRTMAEKNIRTLQTQYSGNDLLTEVEKRGGESSKGVLIAILLVFGYGILSTVSTNFIDSVKNPVGSHEEVSDYSELAVATYFPTVSTTRSYVKWGSSKRDLRYYFCYSIAQQEIKINKLRVTVGLSVDFSHVL